MYWTWSFNVIQSLSVDTLLFMPKKAAKKPKGNCKVLAGVSEVYPMQKFWADLQRRW